MQIFRWICTPYLFRSTLQLTTRSLRTELRFLHQHGKADVLQRKMCLPRTLTLTNVDQLPFYTSEVLVTRLPKLLLVRTPGVSGGSARMRWDCGAEVAGAFEVPVETVSAAE